MRNSLVTSVACQGLTCLPPPPRPSTQAVAGVVCMAQKKSLGKEGTQGDLYLWKSDIFMGKS